jgi:hypothetical protein
VSAEYGSTVVAFSAHLNSLRKKSASGGNTIPQRLKPDSFCGGYGTTKVVP